MSRAQTQSDANYRTVPPMCDAPWMDSGFMAQVPPEHWLGGSGNLILQESAGPRLHARLLVGWGAGGGDSPSPL